MGCHGVRSCQAHLVPSVSLAAGNLTNTIIPPDTTLPYLCPRYLLHPHRFPALMRSKHHRHHRHQSSLPPPPTMLAPHIMDLSFSSSESDERDEVFSPLHRPLLRQSSAKTAAIAMCAGAASIFRFLFPALQALLTPTCRWPVVPAVAPPKRMPSSSRRKVIGTFFGRKRGRVSFAVQTDPRSEPVLLLELAIPMHQLVKEMASGMVRILLECDLDANANTTGAGSKKKRSSSRRRSLWEEPEWGIYCNGHQHGYAVSRQCNGADLHVLKTVQAVSVGAGLLPPPPVAPSLPPPYPLEIGRCSNNDHGSGGGGGSGEVMYMRAKFERVVGSVDSEAFYMISPNGCGRGGSDFNHGGPEISVFLLRM